MDLQKIASREPKNLTSHPLWAGEMGAGQANELGDSWECGGWHLNGLDSGFTVIGKYWAFWPNLCIPRRYHMLFACMCMLRQYHMVSMHSCQLLILVSPFIQTPQVEPRVHLVPLIQWTLQFVHKSCQVKCLHADSKGLGFRKSPLLSGTKTTNGFNTCKAHHWVQRKEVTRTRLPRSLHSLSSSQVRVYPPCFNLIDPTTNTSLKNSCHFMPQLKSTICFHFKDTNINCEGWGLITVMRFPTKMICSSKQGLLQTQIWMHTMFWFLSILTWSWTWTYNEDLWGLWSGSTQTMIISLRHQQMLVVVAKYHDLEQAKHQGLFWAVPTQRAELLLLLLGEATMEPIINQVALQQDHYFLVMSGLITGACRAIIHHTKILENRGTRWNTQKQTKSKERGGGKQASTQAPVF